jgi:hypothetical protein
MLEMYGAAQWDVVSQPLGTAADGFLQSAGVERWPSNVRADVDRAFGVWVRELRIVLIRDNHPKFDGLNSETCEEFIARVAWHEWGHALSMGHKPSWSIARGREMLALAPEGIQKRIRDAGYPAREYLHEVIAETYALLMLRRVKGGQGKPSWLHHEIYDLLRTATGWSE